jgi:hydroxybutyrate-dimer hydrolase
MYDHIKSGKKLPPSQVVRATPRCADPLNCPVVPDLGDANVPAIQSNPAAGDLITISRRTLRIPE